MTKHKKEEQIEEIAPVETPVEVPVETDPYAGKVIDGKKVVSSSPVDQVKYPDLTSHIELSFEDQTKTIIKV